MRRRRREHVRPMPTEEDKRKAQLKAASADPLVWAMKSVDDKFPDEREKDEETIKAEAEIEVKMGATPDDDVMDDDMLDDIDEEAPAKPEVKEIKAEGKTAMPVDEGVLTVDVEPMRQNVDNVTAKEVNKIEGKKSEIEKAEKAERAKKADAEFKEAKKVVKAEKSVDHKTQVQLTALESKQKKMTFALAALVIVALGAVVFGAVAMVNQNKATLELATQIVNSSDHENQVDGEYVYLKDWNMKIKIISGLEHISFDYDENEDGYSKVLIWGARKESGANYTPDFAKQSKNANALGIVTRIPRYERAAAGRLIWYDDYYNYYYQGPTSEPEASETEMSWWVESYLLVKEMLTNADNYIKFDDTTISQQ
ncbi:hypothetical protein IKG07_00135 [Candidatus Saccharibacteria bacterium]|nr:hypothetical protein [Candidatus Saccharibacteria bacterium]